MQKPSAPPLDVPTCYPKNYNTNYQQYVNNNPDNLQFYDVNFNNNRNFIQQPQPTQIIVVQKKNDDNLAKVGCAAAILTFCCMQ